MSATRMALLLAAPSAFPRYARRPCRLVTLMIRVKRWQGLFMRQAAGCLERASGHIKLRSRGNSRAGLMRSKSFEGMVCSIAGVLDAVGDRWAVLILRDLSLGLSRYEDLRKSTDVTHATLSDRLKHLENNELIE